MDRIKKIARPLSRRSPRKRYTINPRSRGPYSSKVRIMNPMHDTTDDIDLVEAAPPTIYTLTDDDISRGFIRYYPHGTALLTEYPLDENALPGDRIPVPGTSTPRGSFRRLDEEQSMSEYIDNVTMGQQEASAQSLGTSPDAILPVPIYGAPRHISDTHVSPSRQREVQFAHKLNNNMPDSGPMAGGPVTVKTRSLNPRTALPAINSPNIEKLLFLGKDYLSRQKKENKRDRFTNPKKYAYIMIEAIKEAISNYPNPSAVRLFVALSGSAATGPIRRIFTPQNIKFKIKEKIRDIFLNHKQNGIEIQHAFEMAMIETEAGEPVPVEASRAYEAFINYPEMRKLTEQAGFLSGQVGGGKKHKKKHKKKGKKTIYGKKKSSKKKHKKIHKKKKSKTKSKTLTLSLDDLFSDNPYFKKMRKKTHGRSKIRYNRKTHKRKKHSKRTHRR